MRERGESLSDEETAVDMEIAAREARSGFVVPSSSTSPVSQTKEPAKEDFPRAREENSSEQPKVEMEPSPSKILQSKNRENFDIS